MRINLECRGVEELPIMSGNKKLHPAGCILWQEFEMFRCSVFLIKGHIMNKLDVKFEVVLQNLKG